VWPNCDVNGAHQLSKRNKVPQPGNLIAFEEFVAKVSLKHTKRTFGHAWIACCMIFVVF